MDIHAFNLSGIQYTPAQPFVIAEIGTSHAGDKTKGAELIAAAAEAGADCVKFQHVIAEEIIHPATGLVPLPGGCIPLYERFLALQTSPDFLFGMMEEAEKRSVVFLCTPFGLQSARDLRRLGVKVMKVASPELNHLSLLAEMASYGLPTILSTGVSRLGDIETAIDLSSHQSRRELALLHCVTAYPAPEEEYNLRVLPLLSGIFGCAVGVSDHSMDPVLVPALTVAMGGSIVEKHICLSRSGDGLDDPIALPPEAFARMVKAIRDAAQEGSSRTLATMADRYGPTKIEAVMGTGIKRLAPSEAANYERTTRSIHASRPILKGEAFGPHNLAILRTEKILRPGLHPSMMAVLLGRMAARDIPDGEGVEWADLGGFTQG
ncbi:MAG: N-acetylneuraminate synthase family protein [Spirochaetia bacterium]|nr:N-acetylneuraminate synthase family protein [Spirochaetia bacterium]